MVFVAVDRGHRHYRIIGSRVAVGVVAIVTGRSNQEHAIVKVVGHGIALSGAGS